jgi:phenylpropionate dioxygenase-like ring-hydroxylating dioxygenase large terminal subunit
VTTPAVVPDHMALRAAWHPVAYASALGATPQRSVLLGEPLVLWRDSSGDAHALADLCIHRGTALSLGHVAGDEVVCPYHAWRFDASGRCTLIPQKTDPTVVPAKARVAAYRCLERYGLIWVALDEPRWPLPDVPEFEDGSYVLVETGPYRWDADASRQLENFTDFGHFPWVHPGLLGDPSRPVVPAHTVGAVGHVLHYSVVRPEATNTDEFPVFANEETVAPERRSRYELHLPYTLVLRLGWGGDEGMIYFFASSPVEPDKAVGYLVIGRNYNLDQPDEVLQEFEDTIFDQDRRVVESQRPEHVPFDLAAELHLKFDAVAVAYRKAMRSQGLTRGDQPA